MTIAHMELMDKQQNQPISDDELNYDNCRTLSNTLTKKGENSCNTTSADWLPVINSSAISDTSKNIATRKASAERFTKEYSYGSSAAAFSKSSSAESSPSSNFVQTEDKKRRKQTILAYAEMPLQNIQNSSLSFSETFSNKSSSNISSVSPPYISSAQQSSIIGKKYTDMSWESDEELNSKQTKSSIASIQFPPESFAIIPKIASNDIAKIVRSPNNSSNSNSMQVVTKAALKLVEISSIQDLSIPKILNSNVKQRNDYLASSSTQSSGVSVSSKFNSSPNSTTSSTKKSQDAKMKFISPDKISPKEVNAHGIPRIQTFEDQDHITTGWKGKRKFAK
jgi:hypothetical protein